MEQFVNKVRNAVCAYFGSGLKITVQKVMKNNGVELTGLIFMERGSDIAAAIYLDSYYEEYEKGTPLGEIVRKVIRTYEERRPSERLNLDFFRDYAQVRTRLACRLVNLEKNRELLAQVPHQVWLDLAVVPCCVLMGDAFGCACILIRYGHMRDWETDEETLLADARGNMQKILRPECVPMMDFLYDMMRQTAQEQLPGAEPGDERAGTDPGSGCGASVRKDRDRGKGAAHSFQYPAFLRSFFSPLSGRAEAPEGGRKGLFHSSKFRP